MIRRRGGPYSAIIALAVVVASVGAAAYEGQNPPWPVPADAAKLRNPVKPTPQGLMAGMQLFHDNCISCHGQTGAGNGPAAVDLVRRTPDFTDAKTMAGITDGELFFRLTKGRGPMLGWDQLSDTERWQLVNTIRTFAK